MARKIWKAAIDARTVGTICNTKVVSNVGGGSGYIMFNDSSSSATGNLYNNTTMQNGLGRWQYDVVDGGLNPTLTKVRFQFDRNGVSATGIQFAAIAKFKGFLNGDEIDIEAKHSFINDDDTSTDQQIATRVMDAWRLGFNSSDQFDIYRTFDQNGNAVMVRDYCHFVNEAGSQITAPYSYGGGYAFILQSKQYTQNLSGSINASGDVLFKKFENIPAFTSSKFDVITKDFDFDYPGIRKNIYKVIVTYRGPKDMSVTESNLTNVKPRYAINGKMRLAPSAVQDWYDFDVTNLPSTRADRYDTRWIRQELKPAATEGMSNWNNIYSLAIRFSQANENSLDQQGQLIKGFEINDISIVYRLKGIK